MATMMFGGVPINVIKPPRIEAKESGISTTAGEREAFTADWMATGISSESAPILFMIADSGVAIRLSAPICIVGVLVAGAKRLLRLSTTPELLSARLRIKTAMTVMVAGCPNPVNACSPGTTPRKTAPIKQEKATMS